jgi:hypothetical protein
MDDKIILFKEKLMKEFPNSLIEIKDNKIYINDKPVGINVDFNASLLLESEHKVDMFEEIYKLLKKEILNGLK